MSFSLITHNGGHFEVEENTGYNGGDIAVANINDVGGWGFFEALMGLLETWDTNKFFSYGGCLISPEYVVGYKSLKVDNDAAKCAEFALLHNCDIHLYVEPPVVENIEAKSSEKDLENGGERIVESDKKYDAHGVYLDDGEEERTLGFDDRFEDDVNVEENVT